jgi:hypothetical protein
MSRQCLFVQAKCNFFKLKHKKITLLFKAIDERSRFSKPAISTRPKAPTHKISFSIFG